jgi:hypothetical protein
MSVSGYLGLLTFTLPGDPLGLAVQPRAFLTGDLRKPRLCRSEGNQSAIAGRTIR